jgi:hypothetical protein
VDDDQVVGGDAIFVSERAEGFSAFVHVSLGAGDYQAAVIVLGFGY